MVKYTGGSLQKHGQQLFVPPVCNDVFVKIIDHVEEATSFYEKDVINYIWTDKKRTIFGLPISFTRYFLTEDKFITRKGFLSIEEDELDLYRVIDKSLSCRSDKECSAVAQ